MAPGVEDAKPSTPAPHDLEPLDETCCDRPQLSGKKDRRSFPTPGPAFVGPPALLAVLHNAMDTLWRDQPSYFKVLLHGALDDVRHRGVVVLSLVDGGVGGRHQHGSCCAGGLRWFGCPELRLHGAGWRTLTILA